MQPRIWMAIAAVSAACAIAAGAFGAHGLKSRLTPELLEVFETGARYHMYAALALGLMAVAGWVRPLPIAGPAWAMLVGSVIFCGSLYALALSGQRWMGAITPFGGVAFLVGWIWLAWSAIRLED